MRVRCTALALPAAFLLGSVGGAEAQDLNIFFPVDSLEHLLGVAEFQLPDTLRGTRFADDRTQRVPLFYEDGTALLAKWAPAPEGGERFNNNPRYEIAPYELQKLFLDPSEYVVPPTVPRMMPLDWYLTINEDVEPTFDRGESVLVVLQYFVNSVTDEDVWDEDRFEADSVYARHWANTNLLTYLIAHKDSNQGNLLISTYPESPRVFAVDNGVSFRSEDSNRGTEWSELQVDRFPRQSVQKLMAITEEQLHRELGILAQWEVQGDQLVRVEVTDSTENWGRTRGFRERDEGVQMGLTRDEIEDVWGRMRTFIARVERGWIEVF